MRSGSTFLGELFNNHDDAFYIFEPLFPHAQEGFSKNSATKRLELLENNIKCNFTDLYDITVPWKEHFLTLNKENITIQQGNVVFRSKHLRLCSQPFCARDVQLEKCNSVCGLEIPISHLVFAKNWSRSSKLFDSLKLSFWRKWRRKIIWI